MILAPPGVFNSLAVGLDKGVSEYRPVDSAPSTALWMNHENLFMSGHVFRSVRSLPIQFASQRRPGGIRSDALPPTRQLALPPPPGPPRCHSGPPAPNGFAARQRPGQSSLHANPDVLNGICRGTLRFGRHPGGVGHQAGNLQWRFRLSEEAHALDASRTMSSPRCQADAPTTDHWACCHLFSPVPRPFVNGPKGPDTLTASMACMIALPH
jgi:hypothetical protein